MELYVVVDTSGSGRVLGVFDSQAAAQRVVAVDPGYYKVHRAKLNELNPVGQHWAASAEQASRLAQLASKG